MGCRKKCWKEKMRDLVGTHRMREDELQFATLTLHEAAVGLGTDGQPIDPWRGRNRAIRFHGNLKTPSMAAGDQRRIEL